jgi:DNA-directed RNA polymerase subunit M/transcription elongation factor TFIIS
MLCPCCASLLEIPEEIEDEEIFECPSCGTSLQAHIYRDIITVTSFNLEDDDEEE